MHLGAAVFAPGARGRWVGTAGAVGTLACIGLTGTRGAWLGAAALGAISLVIGAWRVRPARRVLWPLGAGAVLAAALAAAGIAVALSAGGGSGLGARVRSGVGEVRAAFTSRDYTTDTGLRVAMWRWAWAAVKAHPGNGVGAGGYAAWCRSLPAEQAAALGAPAETARNVHAHAHSWYLHTLATTGVAGAGPLFLMTALAVRAGLRSSDAVARAAPARALGHELLDAYAAGPPLAILGLACAGVFDPITTNQQTSYLFWTLVALCLPMAAGLDEPPAAPAPPAPPAPPGEATP
jgi:O-antigen ligase